MVNYLINLLLFVISSLYYYINLRSSINFCLFSGDSYLSLGIHKQPSRRVLRKRFSENMQQIFRRTPIEITLQHGCSVNLLHIFRTPFLKNISGRLLLGISVSDPKFFILLSTALELSYSEVFETFVFFSAVLLLINSLVLMLFFELLLFEAVLRASIADSLA